MPSCPKCGYSWATPETDGKSIYERRRDRRDLDDYCSTCGAELRYAGGKPNPGFHAEKYPTCPECGDYLFGPVGRRLVEEAREGEE